MATQIGELIIGMAADVARLRKDMDDAKSTVGSAMRDIRQAADFAKLALGAIGVGLSAVAFKDAIFGAIHFAASLDDMSEKTGASVENLSALAKVAKIGGHDLGAMEAGLVRLSKAMAGGDEEAKGAGRAFETLGLKAADLRGMDTAAALKVVADRLSQFKDGSGKTALAMDLLGKSGAALLPYLKDLAEAGELNGRITAEQAAAADQFEKNVVKLKGATGELSKTIAMDLLPSMATLSERFVVATKNADGFWKAMLGGALSSGDDEKNAGARIKSLSESLSQMQADRAGFDKMGSIARAFSVDDIAILDRQIASTKAKIGYLKAVQMEQALASAGNLDARDLRLRQKYDLSGYTSGDKKDGDERIGRQEDAALQSLLEKLDKAKGETSEYDRVLERLTTGSWKAFGEQARANLIALAEQVDAERRHRDALEGTNKMMEKRAALDARLNDLVEGSRLEQEQAIDALRFEASLIGKSNAERERAQALRRIDIKLEKDLLALKRELQDPNEESASNPELDARSAALRRDADEAKRLTAETSDFIRAESRSWSTGTRSAIEAYLDDVNNAAAQSNRLFTNAFKGMEDALVNFVKTGKLDFKSLVDSIISEWTRIQVQQSITGPLAKSIDKAGGLGNFVGSIFSGFKLPSFDVGTDYVPMDMIAQIHKGERIVPAAQNTGAAAPVTITQHINIDSRSDRASILQAMAAARDQAVSAVLSSKRRGGAMA